MIDLRAVLHEEALQAGELVFLRRQHDDIDSCLAALGQPRVWAFSSQGDASLAQARFAPGDALLFGPETRGLPPEVLVRVPGERRLRIPMRPGNRSVNLSNAVAIEVYEAWRQNGFAGGG